MTIGEILLLVGVCVAFVAACTVVLVRKFRHKSGGCGGCCEGCNACVHKKSKT